MPDAARVGDATQHGTPLGTGPGSPDVKIGYMPAWRGVPSSVASAIDGISNAMKSFMDKPVLTPANAAADLAKISQKLTQGGAKAAAAGAPAAASTAGSQVGTINTVNGTLTTAWTSASAAPGGQPAANTAYTEGIKAAAAAAATATVSAMASLSDMHTCPMPCPVPPHGPGFVTKGSSTVLINKLQATRKDDKVMEACGGPDPIAAGCPTVIIGDSGGGGGGGGPGGGGGGEGGGGGDSDAVESTEAIESGEPLDYSDQPPAQAPPGESTQQVETGTHWVSLEMVDEADDPVVGQLFLITLPNGREVRGGLDARGQVKLTGIKQPGTCRIKFPNLDLAAWERWRPSAPPSSSASSASGSPGSAPPEGEQGPVAAGPPQRGGQWRTVSQGECISSIAADTGHFWSTIWDHAANAQLRQQRGDPNVLLPGDAVFVPEKRPKEDSGAIDQHHKFRRRGEPSRFIVFLKLNDEALALRDYELEIDGQVKTGKTSADGSVELMIPGNAKKGLLRVHDGDVVHEFKLSLGRLDPITQLTGVQQRLNNLGYDCGTVDGVMGPRTDAAIRRFQTAHKLTVNGTPDQPTRNKLLEEHRS